MTHPTTRATAEISCDPARLDFGVVHRFLSQAYWCRGIPPETLQRALEHSLCFSAFVGGQQVGFARVVTDRATYAYLCDVFVVPEKQGLGIGGSLMRAVVVHPDLQGLRRFALATRDAHGLYAKFGFAPLDAPDRWMQRYDPDVYSR